MKSSRKSAWILCMGVVVLTGCKGDANDKPAADPLDDAWVDAIGSGDEEPAVAPEPEPLPSAEPEFADPLGTDTQDSPQEIAEASPASEAQPPAASALAAPDKREALPSQSPEPTTPAPATPKQPAAEALAADEQAPPPAPAVEPTPTPSVEPAKPAEPAAPPPITSADFHGSYRYSGGQTQRDELAAAIETTVTSLSRALHGIARKRLTQANPVDRTVDIVIAGGKITTTFESGFSVSCVIDGPAVRTTGTGGERLDVRVRSKGSKLVQHMQGKDGARTIVYVLSADRKKLTVHHKITADRLPEPLTFRLSYSRK
ncbi:MAG: hypothetical protein R6X02_22950 [Enhygromyxa sp.]